jgi:tetratricopeptide (TPR) repeat protein
MGKLMKNLILLFIVAIFSFPALFGQNPSVSLKVRDKSIFKSERNINVELSTEKRDRTLTCDNVNSGKYLYFLVLTSGDWQIDLDFIKESLKFLSVVQDGTKYPATWNDFPVDGKEVISLLIGFDKKFRLNKSFDLEYILNNVPRRSSMTIPEQLWPGFSMYTSLTKESELQFSDRKYREAILTYEKIISTTGYEIFPTFAQVTGKRVKAFDAFLQGKTALYRDALSNAAAGYKDKINSIELLKPEIRFVSDSLPRPSINIMATDSDSKAVIATAQSVLFQMNTSQDSLKRLLDDQNTRWIIDGTATGKNAVQYQAMVRILTFAFLSIEFTDTAATNSLAVKTNEESQGLLTKFTLNESFETFLRMCRVRLQNKLSLLPVAMLTNLERDTAAFPLPYHQSLRAIDQFYSKNYAEAKRSIFRAFRTSYDAYLNERLDLLRIVITMREEGTPEEALRILKEADLLEADGKVDQALEKYRQAETIAPSFPFFKYSLGKFYSRINDPIRAFGFLQQAYAIDTMFLGAFSEAASLNRKAGNYKTMIEVLAIALGYGNDYWDTNFNLGTAHLGDGDIAKAIYYFERAVQWNAKSYETYIQLGLAYQNIKDYSKAQEYFYKAMKLYPDRQAAVKFIEQLQELQRQGK